MLIRNIIVFASVFILSSEIAAVDFNKEISLEDCKTISKCRQGILMEGSWESSGFSNIRCDGFGCWNVYNQICQESQKKLEDDLNSFSSLGVWGKRKSYSKDDFPNEIWDLIKRSAQFEIDCYEKQPARVTRLGANARVYEHCSDRTFTNCKPIKGFTKNFSSHVLKQAKYLLYEEWGKVSRSQHNYTKGDSPRNLSLLQGDFSSLDNASYDSYNASVNTMIESKFLPSDLKKIVAKERNILVESTKYYEQECLRLEKASIEVLEEKTSFCTEFSLTNQNVNNFIVMKKNRLKVIEKEFWKSAIKQAEENPQESIADRSLITAYLNKYPDGNFVKQANDLYEKTLAQEGLKEAKKDSLLGLSEKSLLKKYLIKYPQGKFAKHASSFLEKLLFSYSMSQIKNAPKEAVLPNSYPEQYLKTYPKGEYKDTLSVALEKLHWSNYSVDCAKNQSQSSCEPLLEFLKKFPNSGYIDSARILIDKPMWNSVKINGCVFYEDADCSKIEQYVEVIPKGMHIKDAERILANAKSNSEKREERKERAETWYENEYQNLNEGCSFVTKKDSYDYEWGSDKAFPEKNGSLECIEKMDLTLDSLDTLNYKCVEIEKIVVKGGKIVNGKGFCVNANSDTLARRTFLSNGKFKTAYYFPYKIILSVSEYGDYSINSKSIKLKDIEANKILAILSHAKRTSSLNYLYDIDNFEFDWTKNGQIKNIRISDYDNQNKVMGKINIPLNAKGEKHGISEIYTAATGNFKIEWSNGDFKRVAGGGKRLKESLCPEHVCRNLIWELNKIQIVRHYVPTYESSRDLGYEVFENGWMLHYIAYLSGITINEALKIWNSL